MSVRFTNAAGISLGSNATTGTSAGAATLAFRIRFNWPPASGGGVTYFHSGICDWVTSTAVDTSGGRMNFYHNWWMSSGSPQATGQCYSNAVHYVVVTYNKDDATQQAMYVDGKRALMASPQTGVFDAFRQTLLNAGVFDDTVAGGVDFELEGVLWLLGYAATQDEVNQLRAGTLDPTTIGPGAAQRNYWELKGTQGATVNASDAGITNSLDPSYPSTLHIGSQAGSAMVYGADMPYVSPVGPGDFAVYTSGTRVRVGFTITSTGAAVAPIAGGITTMPTIKIDGGSPITLETPYYTTATGGAMFCLPAGQSVPKDAAVTITTPDNWAETSVGLVPGVTDLSIPNRTGKPVYSDLYPPTLRVGVNNSYRAAYWHDEHGIRNLATRCQVTDGTYTLRADQTLAQVTARPVLSPHSGYTPHPIDDTGGPLELGWYALGYDDNDPANPTVITLRSSDGYHFSGVTELTQYRNDGNPDGTGKVRVYNVQKCTWNVTLGAAITDAAATTITLVDATAIFAAQYTQYIKFDDELMFVMGVSGTTVTVIRGAYGTTPATHANGAAGLVQMYKPFYDISISFDNPTTSAPNYKNLVLYGPSDWTHPTVDGPVVLDKSDAYAKAPSAYDKLAMSNGLGVIRQMDSTDGGFGRSLEPEHQRFDTDLWPGETYNFNVQAKIISSETATVATAPYMYVPYLLQNAEKYTVVLAADITTAPAAGTKETIQITEDAANPVFYGIRIETPAGEVMRVLSQSGNDVEVVRGCERTTPATQAAGDILARYRVPVPNDAAWRTLTEGRIIQTCDANHGLWSHVLGLYTSNDLNPLARINITLTEDIPQHVAADPANNIAGDPYVDFTISVASGDAQYVVSGLYLVFDQEAFRVLAYVPATSTTGRLYTQRAICGWSPGRLTYEQGIVQQAHTSGAAAVGSSGGVYCERSDGGVFSWSDQSGYSSSIVVTGPKSFVSSQGGLLPYDKTLYWTQVGVQTRVPIVDDHTCRCITAGPDSVLSWEQSARTTTFSPGADHWLNIPQYASNDLIDAIATKIRDNLPAGQHRVLVELGNELWNLGTPRLKWGGEMGQVCGYAQNVDMLIYRAWEAFKRVQAVFNDTGRAGEVKFLLAWQQGGIGMILDRAQALGVLADVSVLSTAPYYLPFSETNLDAAYNAATDEEALDLWKFDFEYNYGNIAGSLSADGKAIRDKAASTGQTFEFIHYEGGPDSFTPVPAADVVNGYMRNWDLHYNPNVYDALYDFPFICKRVGGANGIAYFNLVDTEFWNGGQGYSSLWGMSTWNGQPAGRGDGSDGKADNRLCLATPGKTHTKAGDTNIHEVNVSPCLQSMIDYNAAYAAYSPTPGPPSPQSGCVFFMGF